MASEPILTQKGVSTNVDINTRMVEFVDRQGLMIHPVRIAVPFALLKVIAGQINVGEGNGELASLGGQVNTSVGAPSGSQKPA